MEELIIIALVLILSFLAWFFHQKARNNERLALIEKGEDPSKFLNQQEKKFRFTFPWMRLGIIVIGFSLGLATLSILDVSLDINDKIMVPLFSSIIGIFVGTSIIISHFVQKGLDKK